MNGQQRWHGRLREGARFVGSRAGALAFRKTAGMSTHAAEDAPAEDAEIEVVEIDEDGDIDGPYPMAAWVRCRQDSQGG